MLFLFLNNIGLHKRIVVMQVTIIHRYTINNHFLIILLLSSKSLFYRTMDQSPLHSTTKNNKRLFDCTSSSSNRSMMVPMRPGKYIVSSGKIISTSDTGNQIQHIADKEISQNSADNNKMLSQQDTSPSLSGTRCDDYLIVLYIML